MTSITIDKSICRNRTTITSALNESGNIDTTAVTMCTELDKRLRSVPQDIEPQTVIDLKHDIMPESFDTCPLVTGMGCPFSCVAYQTIEAVAMQTVSQSVK